MHYYKKDHCSPNDAIRAFWIQRDFTDGRIFARVPTETFALNGTEASPSQRL